MNKQGLVNALSVKSDITKKDAEKHITNLFDIIMNTTASGEGVKIVGFGNWEKKPTKGATGIIQFGNKRGEKWVTEDSFKPFFNPSKIFKEKVKGQE